ncbi:SLD3-domain-containing protein [Suhomyces tanzawaensis NRRL Y-17324]|uniref:SLD3-domain-containing protein n=1 Tax=Suhomyces tanzawaensis NRRL Y-17324 TaxID=984487 RepID=A0A1E4SII9_9ASCO|nr:SLD3-domain-containing protein [Suhomyces tanzawaensis NRRL Y-17324]ODV79325.1 SLD3-domain-containing protein [Suhomyces tanzawaensis NRRL Y-17324]
MAPDVPTMLAAFPLSFEIIPSGSNSHPLTITVLQPLPNLKFDKVPLPLISLDASRNTITPGQRLFRLHHDSHSVLETYSNSYFFVKIQKRVTDKEHALGIIFNIHNDYYCLADLDPDAKYKDILDSNSIPSRVRHPHDLVPQIQRPLAPYELNSDQLAAIRTFSMKPPQAIQNVQSSPQTAETPLEFLHSRYFTILYSLTIPLSYFPKTALTRFANLCANDSSLIGSTLVKLVWSIEKMDARHQDKYGLLNLMGSADKAAPTTVASEKDAQLDFISKNHTILKDYFSIQSKRKEESEVAFSTKELSNEEIGQKLFLELKIREAQLQILVIFEILRIWKVSETEYLEKCLKKQKKDIAKKSKEAKQSLVRKKNPKKIRKIIPTFLGMGVNVSNIDSSESSAAQSIDEYSLFINLDTIVDRMGVWDTLLGRTKGNDSDSAYGFLAYVLVPYYNKKLPIIVKYVIDKIKDLNMKLVTPSFKKFERDLQRRSSEGSSPREDEDTDKDRLKEPARPSKFRKTLLHQKVPTLKKSATIDLSEDDNLRPAFALKRSKSNLSSKHLQKRQVDISINTEKSQKDKAAGKSTADQGSKENSSSFIFTKVKRTKLTASTKGSGSNVSRTSSISQVQATPSKNRLISFIDGQAAQVDSPPTKALHAPNSYSSALISQIESTPQNKGKVVDFTEIINTPQQFVKPSTASDTRRAGLSEKLFQASELTVPAVELGIMSSPVKPQETPKENIVSSPLSTSSRRKKPGEPISVSESPFFNPSLNGSPVYGGIFGGKRKSK